MPIVLKPYEHENEQFGQAPDFPVENEIYFDRRNRPSILTGNAVATLRDGQWTTTKLTRAAGLLSTKIAYDRDNGLYALANDGRTATLFHSTDGGRTFTAWALPGRDSQSRTFDIEQFSGHNVPAGPPPILRYTRTVKDEKLFWRSLHDLELFLPKKIAGRLVIGEPVLISTRCIGLTAHSGIPASVVSRGSKVHVAWGEATDPKDPGPGVPAYVATYDRETGELSKPALVGYGGPPNDLHNSPSITIDSQGYLHVLGGTHAQPFPYARSLQPNDAGAGWTEAVPVGEDLRQTYIGLVCGPDDTLHSVSRLWRPGADPFPASIHATLAYQRKRAGQPWEPPRILVVPPLSEYSVYYHRLTIDRRGRLFISYDYWSTFWFYRNDHPGRRRTVLMSSDSGNTWKLAETTDLK
ncbi:BNR-4 repeat-containing protein [bacterium]|nr:BNR-4 repeat-containing protein [bacterium]